MFVKTFMLDNKLRDKGTAIFFLGWRIILDGKTGIRQAPGCGGRWLGTERHIIDMSSPINGQVIVCLVS